MTEEKSLVKTSAKKREYDHQYYATHREEVNRQQREYYQKNKEKANNRNNEKHRARRLLCIEHYGGKCECCGEDRVEFLCFDHIDGGGNEDRRKNGKTVALYLIRNNFPEGFRLLCHNCNSALGCYGYCPHHPEIKVDYNMKRNSKKGEAS